MRLCYKLGIAAVVLLLPRISAYPASTPKRIDFDPVISLMRAEAPRCAVVCGMSCIRPWAPPNDTGFPMPYEGGFFECLRSGPATRQPSGASSKPLLRGLQGRALGQPRYFNPLVETTLRHARLNDPKPPGMRCR